MQKVSGSSEDATYESEQCFDSRNRWTSTTHNKLYSKGQAKFVSVSSSMYFDGVRFTTIDNNRHTFLVSDYRGQRRTEAGVDCWLGRHVDLCGQFRLGELLLAAADLSRVADSKEGLPVVSGTVQLTQVVALLEVEIDVRHGFAPRTITIRDAGLRAALHVYRSRVCVVSRHMAAAPRRIDCSNGIPVAR